MMSILILQRLNPVSYTHLDVYKRQVLYCTLTGASVTNMFSQGMVIGILIMIVLILEALYLSLIHI